MLYDSKKFASEISITKAKILVLLICFKNLVPSPTPKLAPLIIPGISAIIKSS